MTTPRRSLPAALLLLGILLVASNLRAVITAVGPVLPILHAEGMSPTTLGILVAIPVGTFAVVSPVVHSVATRFGVQRTVLLALLVLAAGTLTRSFAGATGLWVGTVIIGAGIAVGNVLLPSVTKEDFPRHVPLVTGGYIAVQSLIAGLASGLSVPLALAWGSWELSLAVWALLVIVAVAVWVPRLAVPSGYVLGSRAGPPTSPSPERAVRAVTLWTHPVAWHVGVYFLLQSSIFYTLMNWLPTVEADMGLPAVAAGWHLSLFMVIGILANLAVPAVIHRGGDQRFAAVGGALLMIIAMAGMLTLPTLQVLWVALAGMSSGASMVVSLSLIGLRAGDPVIAGRLSAMAQTVAYSGVAVTLVVDGVIRELAGPGTHLLVLVLVLGVLQSGWGLVVGRSRILP